MQEEIHKIHLKPRILHLYKTTRLFQIQGVKNKPSISKFLI